MKNIEKNLPSILLLILFFLVFKTWFTISLIAAGDFLSHSQTKINDVNLLPTIWGWNPAMNQLGGITASYQWIYFVINMPIFFFGKLMHLNWMIIERIVYLYPLLLLLIVSPIKLFQELLPKTKFKYFASILYGLNTFILMVIGGGQIFIALSYSLLPLTLYSYIKHFNEKNVNNFRHTIITGLLLSLQIILDLRFAYITFIIILLFFIFKILSVNPHKNIVLKVLPRLIFIFFIPFLIHIYWLLPAVMLRNNLLSDLGSAYTSWASVRFFSFARLENTISLLHPNWPENIFGKISFMKPEFLLLPILAYSSLFFVCSESRKQRTENKSKIILFFALLGLLGAFLAKGAQEPFGGIYIWMFTHIPGFIMFRDPTKWYTLIALSYSILIPYSISQIYEWLRSQSKFSIFNFQFSIKSKIFNIQNLFILLLTSYFLLLISPALFGQLGGTFKKNSFPQEYSKLEQFLLSSKKFSRTLWIPSVHRFAYYSNTHPAISSYNYYNSNNISDIIKILLNKNSQKQLQEASVNYVIVPYDSEEEIFLKDRKYDEDKYQQTIAQLHKIKWLTKIKQFGKIIVYELPAPKEHFWSPQDEIKIDYVSINPTKYQVNIRGAKKGGRIIFAENFDMNWIAKKTYNNKYEINSSKYNNLFNSFVLIENGNYELEIYYKPQKLGNIGLLISGFTFIMLCILLLSSRFKDKI